MTKLLVIDTMQCFEFEVPKDINPEEFVNSDACRKECAARILNQTTDLRLDSVYENFNKTTEEWD